MRLTWTRVRPGLYRSGLYSVGKAPSGEWFCEGPGTDEVFPTKREAQDACEIAWEYEHEA